MAAGMGLPGSPAPEGGSGGNRIILKAIPHNFRFRRDWRTVELYGVEG